MTVQSSSVGAFEKSDWVRCSGNGKRLMVEATRGGGGRQRPKGIAVCISSASPRLRGPKAKQRQALRHCARAHCLASSDTNGKQVSLDGLRSIRSLPLGRRAQGRATSPRSTTRPTRERQDTRTIAFLFLARPDCDVPRLAPS